MKGAGKTYQEHNTGWKKAERMLAISLGGMTGVGELYRQSLSKIPVKHGTLKGLGAVAVGGGVAKGISEYGKSYREKRRVAAREELKKIGKG